MLNGRDASELQREEENEAKISALKTQLDAANRRIQVTKIQMFCLQNLCANYILH